MPTLEGNDLDNELTGGDESDTINGFGGRDRLLGKGGNDTISGGTGEDFLAGGAGSDSLSGGDDRDILFGGEANLDALNAVPFSETEPPAFSLIADSDPDTFNGGAGNDVFFAGYGDTVVGGGSEINGADVVHLSYLGAPHGINYAWGSALPNVTITDAHVRWIQGSNFADTFRGISHVLAMGGDDRISVSNLGSGLVDGGDGNDVIEVYPLTHEFHHVPFFGIIRGGAGNDTIIGRSDDTDGGDGDDIIYGDGRGGAGNDILDVSGLPAIGITISGDAGWDILRGGGGDDHLSAGAEISFDVGTEVDHLFGGAGNDFLFSGFGDIVDGGQGFDTVGLSYVGASAGITGDTAILHRGEPLVPGGGTFNSIERFSDIALTNFDDRMVIGDQKDSATVRAWNGNDHLIGQEMSITMYGGNGNDFLVGSTSFDVLYGEKGDDTLIGFLGADLLYGGEGSDRFIFNTLDLLDRVMDFERGTDKIDVSDLDANTAVAGNQAFTFIGDAAFSGAAGELRAYAGANNSYFIAGDVNGDRTADIMVQVDITLSGTQLTASDMLL
jgi:Ca2+-binding RTX toxin-like protein